MSCVGALPPFFCFVRFSFAGRSGLAANLPRPIRGNSLPLPCLIRMHSDSQLTVISTVKYNGSMRLQQVLRRLICMHTYNTCTQTHTLTLPHTHSESLSGSLTRSLAHSLSLSRALCLCLSACFTHTHTHTHLWDDKAVLVPAACCIYEESEDEDDKKPLDAEFDVEAARCR